MSGVANGEASTSVGGGGGGGGDNGRRCGRRKGTKDNTKGEGRNEAEGDVSHGAGGRAPGAEDLETWVGGFSPWPARAQFARSPERLQHAKNHFLLNITPTDFSLSGSFRA